MEAECCIPKHEMLCIHLNFVTAAVLDFSGNVKPHRPLLGVSPAVNSLISVCCFVIVMGSQIACETNNEKKSRFKIEVSE